MLKTFGSKCAYHFGSDLINRQNNNVQVDERGQSSFSELQPKTRVH
jgi:hypothetical protein